jgi:hypothetical protein
MLANQYGRTSFSFAGVFGREMDVYAVRQVICRNYHRQCRLERDRAIERMSEMRNITG